MNKTAVIIGSFALLGVGVFFYFKTKPKSTVITGTTGSNTSGAGTSGSNTSGAGTSVSNSSQTTSTTSVPPIGTVLTTNEQVADMAKKIAEAKSLATKISDLRAKRSSYLIISLKEYAVVSGNKFFANNDLMLKALKDNDIIQLEKNIKDLDEQLGKLGYIEVNGSISRII
jgi:hypothetical protein